jgi:hypothetical protein
MWPVRLGVGGRWWGAAPGPLPASAPRHRQTTREGVMNEAWLDKVRTALLAA